MCSWKISEESFNVHFEQKFIRSTMCSREIFEKNFPRRFNVHLEQKFICSSMCSRDITEKNSLESLMCIAFILISKLPLMATVDLKNKPVLWTKIHSFILEAVVKQIIWTKVHSFVNIKARGFWKELIPLDLKLADFWKEIVNGFCLWTKILSFIFLHHRWGSPVSSFVDCIAVWYSAKNYV